VDNALLNDEDNVSEDDFEDEEITANVDGPPLIEPTETVKNRIHPRVRRIGVRSTSVGAKFKSLYPKPLQIWYDDGAQGVEQGQLGPGKETTTNTYVGHVFYFTEVGDRAKKRVASVTISAEQV
jgi:hypothetical protein